MCVFHIIVSNGLHIKYNLMTHSQASLSLPCCSLIWFLVMAYLESSILKSERSWMTAVIKPCHEKKKERVGKDRDIAVQFRQIYIDPVGFLFVMLFESRFLTN